MLSSCFRGLCTRWRLRILTDQLDLSYPAILEYFGTHSAHGRAESSAFLAWFLENYYHLEEQSAQDAVCDGTDDKGIDGIFVDDNLERVDIFQSKLYQNTDKTVGDRSLRDLAGAIDQLSDAEKVTGLLESTGNIELRRLIEHEEVAKKIQDGYGVKGVFVTNASADKSARRYANGDDRFVLYDATALSEGYVSIGSSGPVSDQAVLDVGGFDVIQYKTAEATVIVAPILASELVQLEGIQNGELFDWNVRQSLGRTKVNKAISQSVQDQSQHANFLLYHNGLTILTTNLKRERDTISLSGYSVVNGCQSLTSLYENRDKITSDLRLLGRLIQLPPSGDLAALITRHSNNQNSISARDLQSNSTIQRRLQNDIEIRFPDYFYEIKRGEISTNADAKTISNEEAARILLAFDVRQPWSCHQSYKLFDELHLDIFARPEVDAVRIVALYQAYLAVLHALSEVQPQVLGKYRLVQYFLLSLLRMALDSDPIGRNFCQDPTPFVADADWERRLQRSFSRVLADLIIDLNAEVESRSADGEPFDYKRELKSPQSVRGLQQSIIPMYKKAVDRRRATGFGAEWEESAAD